MPFIKKLVLKGFKSFAKRTEIPFEYNYSCIIGENGSGKSNIMEAVCFVLGTTSAKSLRAEKTANLIFKGGKSGSPAKEAEVSIVFDNSSKVFPVDTPEVTITRIVKLSGNSIYKINNEVMTRQQVVDTLAKAKINPEGYNIVLQGDINRFILMKPVERRMLVEDIAGIGVYEEKKQKAMLELEKVQAKLNEADIILTERQKTLAELKKDRDIAVVYSEKAELLKRSKATRISLLIKEKLDKKQEIERKLGEIKASIEKMNREIEQMKSERQLKLERIKQIEAEMDAKGNVEQKEIAKQIEALNNELIRSETRLQVVKNELKKVSERKSQIGKEESELNAKINALQKEKAKLNKQIEELRAKEAKIEQQIVLWKEKHGLPNVSEINAKIAELDRIIDEKQQSAISLNNQVQELLRAIDAANLELRQIEEQDEKARKQREEDKGKIERLKAAKKEFAEVVRRLADAKNENSVFAIQLADARKAYNEANEDLARLRIRISSAIDAASDIALAKVKSANIAGVYGCVSELGTVDSKYSMALDVAAGQKLKSVVVSNDAVAEKCIQLLKESRAGVLTFLPLNKLKERAIEQEALDLLGKQGVLGLALDFVSFEPKFKNVFKYVFGGTLVIDSIETARRLGIGRARMVTLEGDLMEPSGAMIGGFRKKSGFGFQEKNANEELKKAEEKLAEITEKVDYLEKKKQENEKLIEEMLEKRANLEAEIKGLEATMGTTLADFGGNKEALLKQIENANKNIKEIKSRIEKLEKERSKAIGERQALQQKVADMASSTVSSELEKMEAEKAKIREEIIKSDAQMRSLDTAIGMHETELNKLRSVITSSIQRDSENFNKEKAELETFILEGKAKLNELQTKQKQFYKDYENLFKEKDKIKTAIGMLDTKLLLKEEKIRHTEEGSNEYSVRIAEILGEIAGLEKEFEEFKDVQLRRGLSLEDLNGEIKAIERELQSMGNINMRALEVYEKADAEHKELLQKYETLKNEKEQVLQMMFEIDSKKKEAFMKTYKNLLKNFTAVFSAISTKGDATLVLENEENPFEGGLNIEVRLGSNRYIDLISLSGGEKSLAALAFIFAIQEFDPAPFYLLDEIDSALDKRHSELVSSLIAKYSAKSQYITISHNDTVISDADAVYGVSFQDGISKVVSLKL